MLNGSQIVLSWSLVVSVFLNFITMMSMSRDTAFWNGILVSCWRSCDVDLHLSPSLKATVNSIITFSGFKTSWRILRKFKALARQWCVLVSVIKEPRETEQWDLKRSSTFLRSVEVGNVRVGAKMQNFRIHIWNHFCFVLCHIDSVFFIFPCISMCCTIYHVTAS